MGCGHHGQLRTGDGHLHGLGIGHGGHRVMRAGQQQRGCGDEAVLDFLAGA